MKVEESIYIKSFIKNTVNNLFFNQYILFGSIKTKILFLVGNVIKDDKRKYLPQIYNFLETFSKIPDENHINAAKFDLQILKPHFEQIFFFTQIKGIPCALGMELNSVKRMVDYIVDEHKFVNNNISVEYPKAYKLNEEFFIDNLYKIHTPNFENNKGVFCRSCGEFNNYAEIDNVVNDNRYTCWNCANHYIRVYKGLHDDNLEQLVTMIKRNNNIV